jgi:membrane associated rhomboid family serine protease
MLVFIISDNYDLSPWCSEHVLNPDRIWCEPIRFFTYGLVHNSIGHLVGNVFTQLFVGLPLEFSHSSWRVAIVYISGIVLGGLGREVLTDTKNPANVLAGASGIL